MEFSVTLPSRITADVSFNETVRFVGITGPSGAGKSSLLRALAGVEPKSDVVVDWGGRTSKIGIVFQQPMLFPHVNVRGNFALATRYASDNAMQITEALKGCCCEHLIDKDVSTLSGGEAQRVAIARALVNGPDVLLLDESLSAIDVNTRRKIYRFLKSLCDKQDLICMVISHDLDDLALFSDEMLYVADGAIAAQGNINALIEHNVSKGEVESSTAMLCGVLAEDLCDNATNGAFDTGIVGVEMGDTVVYVCRDNIAPENALDHREKPSDKKWPSEKKWVRFAVKACDVSVDTNTQAIDKNTTSSILNALKCTITAITEMPNAEAPNESAMKKGKVLLTLAIDENSHPTSYHSGVTQFIYASISVMSLKRLNLAVGTQVIARFKLA